MSSQSSCTQARWIDSHVHVSRFSPEGVDRGDILAPLLSMVHGAGLPGGQLPTDEVCLPSGDASHSELGTNRKSQIANRKCTLLLSVDVPEVGRMRHEPEMVVEANRWLHTVIERAPDSFRGSCLVNPHFLDASLQAMELCFGEWGFVQLGEMLQYIMEYEMDSPAVVTLARRAIELDVPMQIHVSTNTEKGVEHVAGLFALADRVPELKIVVAHCLGGRMSDYYLDVLAARRAEGRAGNLWVEIRDFNHVPALRRALAEGWEDRLLAGTDWVNRVGPPFLPYGTIFGVTRLEDNPYPPGVPALAGFLREAGATSEQVEKIAWRNAADLYRLPGPVADE